MHMLYTVTSSTWLQSYHGAQSSHSHINRFSFYLYMKVQMHIYKTNHRMINTSAFLSYVI